MPPCRWPTGYGRRTSPRAEALVGTQAQSITPAGTASNTFQSTGFIVNCPLISIFANN